MNPLSCVDKLLDKITSYRLVLYCLYTVLGLALIVSAFNRLPFKWYDLTVSGAWLSLLCFAVDYALAFFLDIAKNKESDLITAAILALIISPAVSFNDYVILSFAAIAAIASKYILVLNRRHIFNPAATGAFLSGILLHHYASWWVGTNTLLPLVAVCGFLIVRKMKRFFMLGLFLVICIVSVAVNLYAKKHNLHGLSHNLWLVLSASPVIFFSTVMLTEPATSPTVLKKYVPYTFLVGLLYSIPRLRLNPEEALLAGNLLSYTIAPNKRLFLAFVGLKKEAEGIYSFMFSGKEKLKFNAGQYMEWTLPKTKTDSRGNRRYLTLSSSPTEDKMMFTIKLPSSKMSAFKGELVKFTPESSILASQLSGSFTLPKNKDQKLVFVAGGVGVTPYRSMIKYLVDTKESRDITLLYSVDNPSELSFIDLFRQAQAIGLKTAFASSNPSKTPTDWTGYKGYIDATMIKATVPEYKNSLFYISGPFGFVESISKTLGDLGVRRKQLKKDYFPGYG